MSLINIKARVAHHVFSLGTAQRPSTKFCKKTRCATLILKCVSNDKIPRNSGFPHCKYIRNAPNSKNSGTSRFKRTLVLDAVEASLGLDIIESVSNRVHLPVVHNPRFHFNSFSGLALVTAVFNGLISVLKAEVRVHLKFSIFLNQIARLLTERGLRK